MNPQSQSLGTGMPIGGSAISTPGITTTPLSHIYQTASIQPNPAGGDGEDIVDSVDTQEADHGSVMTLEEINGSTASQCHLYYATDQQTSDEELPPRLLHSDELERGFRVNSCSPHRHSHHHRPRLSESPVTTGVKGAKGGSVEKISRTNLYIKGLPDSFNDEQLWHLPPDGTQIKSVKAAMDDDCRCRGYGFIDFTSELAANDAMRYIKETHPGFIIKFAKENEKDRSNLYVTNLPKSWTTKDSDQLKAVFERFGAIQSAFVMMERTTNRTTGVGFVRFANERDALAALECIKAEPIILSDCTAPIEAKFADKHNQETRRRRFPASVPLSNSHQINNLFHTYPLGLTSPVNPLVAHDPLTAFLTMQHGANSNHSTSASPKGQLSSSSANLHSLQLKGDYTQRLAQTLLNNSVKLSSTNSSNYTLGLADFPTTTAGHAQIAQALDPTLATLTAAAAAAGLLNNCFRADAAAGASLMSSTQVPNHHHHNNNAAGGLLPTNPLSFLTAAGTLPSAEAAILNTSLYGCPVFGADFYHTAQGPTAHPSAQVTLTQSQQQQQQQRNLFEATIAAMNGSANITSLLPGLPDLSQFIHYPGLLSSQQAVGLGTPSSCLRQSTGATGLTPLYAHQANGLVSAESLLSQPGSVAPESIGLVAQKSLCGLQPWLVPSSQVIKNGTSIDANLNQSA